VSVSLPTLMDVLDHADAAQNQREALIQATLALKTGHRPEDVAAGVDTHLAQQTLVPSVASAPFDFRWPRPQTKEELSFQWNESRDARIGKQKGSPSPYAIKRGLVGGLLCGLLVGSIGTMAARHHPILAFLFSGASASLLGLPICMLLDSMVDQCAARRDRYIYWIFMPTTLKRYLECIETRAYLRAVITSGLPKVLRGDKERLEAIYAAHEEKQKKKKARQDLDKKSAEQDELLATLMKEGEP
jgi:hypothetical protein